MRLCSVGLFNWERWFDLLVFEMLSLGVERNCERIPLCLGLKEERKHEQSMKETCRENQDRQANSGRNNAQLSSSTISSRMYSRTFHFTSAAIVEVVVACSILFLFLSLSPLSLFLFLTTPLPLSHTLDVKRGIEGSQIRPFRRTKGQTGRSESEKRNCIWRLHHTLAAPQKVPQKVP